MTVAAFCIPRSQTPFGNALAEAIPLPISVREIDWRETEFREEQETFPNGVWERAQESAHYMTTLLSAEDFIKLVDQGNDESQSLLRSASASESVWKEVIEEYPDYRHAVCLGKSLPDNILRLLAADPDPLIRSTIAMKRSLPLEVFVILAQDSDESVRARIAWNERTPSEILIKLAADLSSLVAVPARARIANRS